MAKFSMGKKSPKKEVIAALQQRVPDITNGAFLLRFKHDDGGEYVEIMAEREEGAESSESAFHDHLHCAKFMGWRTTRLNVPHGYIEVFFKEDGSERLTRSADND